MLNAKQAAFVEEYFRHGGNCRQAAIAAGYTAGVARGANYWAMPPEQVPPKMRDKAARPEIYAAISARRRELEAAKKASADEIVEYLTTVVRGESRAPVVVIEGEGDGVSSARLFDKPPDERERLAAADKLAKVLGMYETKVNLTAGLPVIISGEDKLDG